MQADIFDEGFIDTLRAHPLYPFDILTSNPPYIPRAEWERLPPSVKLFEDPRALIGEGPSPTTAQLEKGDAEGLAFYNRIAHLLRSAPDVLKPGGRVVLEVGKGQGGAVKDIFDRLVLERGGEGRFEVRMDGSGIGRCVWGRIP